MLHLLPHHASLLPVPPTMPPCDGASVCPIHAEPLCSQVEVGHHPSSPVYWLRRFMQEEAVWCHLRLTGSVTSVSGSRGSTLTSSCHPRCRHRGPLHQALSSLHAPRISKRADWCGCGVERDYATLRVLHTLLWESLEAATVLTEAMFLNGRGTMGCHLEMSLALSRRRLHQPM
jgi:hypothetical protein